MIYMQLFFSFLLVGLFSIGGGYAAIPLIQAQVVQAHAWLSMAEFTNLVTIAEMTPGPIAVNAATFVGIRIAGVPGAVVATLGCIFPALILVSVLAYVYRRYKSARPLHAGHGGIRRGGPRGGECAVGGSGAVLRRLCAAALAQMEPHSGDVPVRRGQPCAGPYRPCARIEIRIERKKAGARLSASAQFALRSA